MRPDIVHGHLHEGAAIGAVAGRLIGAPVILDFQGSLTAEMVDHHFLSSQGGFYPLWRRAEKLIDRWPDAILTSSGSAVGVLTDEFHCPSGKVHVVPDGVNADVFHPLWQQANGYDGQELAVLRQSLGLPEHHKVVVYLGLLAEHQGTSHLLRAAAYVVRQRPDTHFLIMGFPNVEGYYQEALKLGLERNVSFPGRIAYGKAPLYLALGDVAVSPKMSVTEGAGKLLNYMAMGLPVVSFDTPVAREYLGDDAEYAALGDAEAFGAAIVRLLDDSDRRAALSRRLRRRAVQQFSWQQMGERIVAVYDRLLEKGNG